MSTIADGISALLHDDGKRREADDGRSFAALVAKHDPDVDWRWGLETEDIVRFKFTDGSVLVSAGDGWDFGYANCFCWRGIGHVNCSDPADEPGRMGGKPVDYRAITEDLALLAATLGPGARGTEAGFDALTTKQRRRIMATVFGPDEVLPCSGSPLAITDAGDYLESAGQGYMDTLPEDLGEAVEQVKNAACDAGYWLRGLRDYLEQEDRWGDDTYSCIYCGAEITGDEQDPVPHDSDDDAWADIADEGEHAPDCEWVLTRAHRKER